MAPQVMTDHAAMRLGRTLWLASPDDMKASMEGVPSFAECIFVSQCSNMRRATPIHQSFKKGHWCPLLTGGPRIEQDGDGNPRVTTHCATEVSLLP